MENDNREFNSVDINKIVPTSDATGLKSLFEKDAYIDLGKGNAETGWDEYKKDEKDGKTFVLNSKITNPLNGYDTLVKVENKYTSYTIDEIIAFTEKREQMKLEYQHFAYCSRLGFYPNNRLVTLRRFRGAVGDDIYQNPSNYDDAIGADLKSIALRPISTMVTWLKDDESLFGGSTEGFSFGIKFSDYTDGFIATLKKSYSEYTSGAGSGSVKPVPGWKDSLTNFAITSFLDVNAYDDKGVLDEKKVGDTNKLTKVDGTEIGRFAANNPNMIGQGKHMDSLSSEIKFSLTFEYQMRYISNIDPTIAMLDLLSTAMHMGSNESEFRYNINQFVSGKTAQQFYKIKYNNTSAIATSFLSEKLTNILSSTIKATGNFFGKIVSKVGDTVGKIYDDATGKKNDDESFVDMAVTQMLDRYREDLKAAISVDTGLPSGGWHVMIGDPQNPFISCGDLVVGDDCNVKFGKELGPGGFPTSFIVSYSLKQARPRGRQEIMKIFNGGRGRVYTYKAAKDNPDYGIFK